MQQYHLEKKRGVTVSDVIQIMKKHGQTIDQREGELILEIAYKFGKLWVEQQKNGGRMPPSPRRMTPRNLYR